MTLPVVRKKFALGLPLAAGLLLLPSGAWADVVTWTGGSGGTGTSWNVGTNWGGALPAGGDEATFTSTGLAANKIISLDASQTINTLTISTATAFTIGTTVAGGDLASGNMLTLANVNRSGTSGGIQTIAANVVLSANSTWTIGSGDRLVDTGGISGNQSLTLSGGGELDLNANTYTGATTINAGTLKATTANGAINGDLVVGDGGTTAAAYVGGSNTINKDIASTSNVTVNSNGTLTLAANGSETINNLVINGGSVLVKLSIINGPITMTGGSIALFDSSSFSFTANSSITTNASSSMAVISAPITLNKGGANVSFVVAEGAAPIDLQITGGFRGGSSGKMITKSGAGVMEISGGSNQFNNAFSVTGGTLLVDNPTVSGTGPAAISVSGGATLGGVGFIGGVSGDTVANVTLTGTNSSTLATLAPGTIDSTTGNHIIGKLSVGSTTQNNNVTFGNNSRLAEALTAAGTGDQLAVTGALNLNGGSSDRLELSAAPDVVATLADGTYTWVLATFTGTLNGRFGAITLNGVALPADLTVEYLDSAFNVKGPSDVITNGSIVLVPEPCSLGIALSGTAASLLARRKRRGNQLA